ncbi:MAG: glycoside hydrolase family 3 C-terminal domain-containing protein, partial [Prolixibacteraceae bacterium]|nr:glycoside hydrolase family 3 C-terminal domain-containing protein [Prolixibacteraceae bacterium]
KEHDEAALEMALKTMTLLKNDGTLPLNKKKIKSIAVVGPNANTIDALRANYFGDASNPVTILAGIQKAAGEKIKVSYDEGCPIVEYEGSKRHDLVESKHLNTIDAQGNYVPGLKGEYFRGKELSGEPVFTQVNPQIRMYWGEGSPTETMVAQGILTPEQALEKDNFSVRWTGTITAPQSGTFEFGAMSDDGCRIYLDGKLIVDDWTEHEMIPSVAEVNFVGGKNYDLKIEYYEAEGNAGVWLVWKKLEEKVEVKGPFEPSAEMLANVKKADVAIFVGGLDANWEGEEMRGREGIDGFRGGDRTKIELPAVQLKTLRAMQATGTPVIFVLIAGSAISFDGLENELPAIVMAWYPGQRGGDAVAQVLFGDYNPAGRLPVTFYHSTDDLSEFTNYNMQAGKGFTYRYFTGEPLYAFGHGLSYTTFEYSDLSIDKTSLKSNDEFTVNVKVKNTGKRDGEEVVQLYVRDVEASLPMANKQLRSFDRVALAAGEEKVLTFKLNPKEDFRYYNAMMREYQVEPGDFEIQLGASSSDIRIIGKVTVE